jgi:hypothetical protein
MYEDVQVKTEVNMRTRGQEKMSYMKRTWEKSKEKGRGRERGGRVKTC